jgi:hypothetical protein
MRRILRIAGLIALFACLTGAWICGVTIYRYLSWGSIDGVVIGEGKPVLMRLNSSVVGALNLEYEFELGGKKYTGRDVVRQFPVDRRVPVRYSRNNPAQNGIRLVSPGWATALFVGGGLLGAVVYAVRTGVRAVEKRRKSKSR